MLMTRITRPLSTKRPFQRNPALYRIETNSQTETKSISGMRRVLQALKDLPVATMWTVVLALGGVQLLVFFATVGFVPNIDLKAAASLLAATALLGVGVVAMIAVMFALPSVVLAVSFPVPTGNRQIIQHILESVLGVMGMPILIVAVSIAQSPSIHLDNASWHLTALILVSMVLACCYLFLVEVGETSGAKKSARERFEEYFNAMLRISGWFAWSACVGFITALLLRSGEMSAFYATFLVFPLVIALSSILLFAFSGKRRWIKIAALGICSVVLHSVVTGQPTWFIHATIERLGYSYGSQLMRVVLNESGCAIVNMAFDSTAPKPPVVAPSAATCVFDAERKMGVVQARITSRIGSPYVLEIPEKDESKVGSGVSGTARALVARRVLVRAEDVLTWLYDSSADRRRQR
jgi:hypothetical protein